MFSSHKACFPSVRKQGLSLQPQIVTQGGENGQEESGESQLSWNKGPGEGGEGELGRWVEINLIRIIYHEGVR